MIVGLGIDVVEIERVRAFAGRWGEPGLSRLFTPRELAYCLARPDAAPSLAARFAAKEALFKALGTGWGRGGDWTDVEVVRKEGPPGLALSGRAAEAARLRDATRQHLTLSHSRSSAAAVVVLERA